MTKKKETDPAIQDVQSIVSIDKAIVETKANEAPVTAETQIIIKTDEVVIKKQELTYFEEQLILLLESVTESLRILCTTQGQPSNVSYTQLIDQMAREEDKYKTRKG